MNEEDKINEVVTKLDGPVNRNACPKCSSTDSRVEDYDMMWHDGKIVCNKCNTFIRSFDAG